MEKHQKKSSGHESDIKNSESNIRKGSGQDDQLEKLKDGEKSKKDDSGSRPTPHIQQDKDDETRVR